jgi:hypothetical protein
MPEIREAPVASWYDADRAGYRRTFLSGYGRGTDLVAGLLHFANSKELFRARLCNLYDKPAHLSSRSATTVSEQVNGSGRFAGVPTSINVLA